MFSFSDLDFKTCVSIGKFDGVHPGHKYLLQKNIELAKAKNLQSVAIVIYPDPKVVCNQQITIKALQTVEQRIRSIQKIGIDKVLVLDFNKEVSQITAHQFLDSLVRNLKMKAMVVGDDFVFGRHQKGTIEFLKIQSQKQKFDLEVVKKIQFDGLDISSTRFRNIPTQNENLS